jgi:hypothetical protein
VILRRNLYWALHDLRIIVDVLANMNQSSHRSRVEVLAWGDFPNAYTDLVTLLYFRHFLVQLAIGVTGDVSWIQQLPGMVTLLLYVGYKVVWDGTSWESSHCITLNNTFVVHLWPLWPKDEEVSFSLGLWPSRWRGVVQLCLSAPSKW